MNSPAVSPKVIQTVPLFNSSFNQDFTSLAVGYQGGYKLFNLPSLSNLNEISHCRGIKEVAIVERLFSSSLVAIVSLQTPRTLNIYHFKKGSEICNYSYSHTVLSVKLNRVRVVVCLEEAIYIHSIKDMKVLHIIRDLPKNPTGICDLSPSTDNSFLAYPVSSSMGHVQVFDSVNLRCMTIIHAHDTSIAALAFNESGSKLVTASEKGTLIRVFNVSTGEKLHELRRGLKTIAAIQSLSFALNSGFVVVSSNKETVHIFKLSDPKDRPQAVTADQSGLTSWVSSCISSSANYLPTQVADMWTQDRAFATVMLPSADMRTTCALTLVNNRPVVLVSSSEGSLYVYDFSVENGGECQLLHRFRFNEPETTTVESNIAPEPEEQPLATTYAKAVSGPTAADDPDEDEDDEASGSSEPSLEKLKVEDDY